MGRLERRAAVITGAAGGQGQVACLDTQMPRNFVSDLPDKDEIWRSFERGHLVQRVGRAEEVVPLAIYLASEKSSFMTGAVIPIDGGWSVQ